MKNIFFIILILLSSLYLSVSDCIPNKNCLKERGECIDNVCECYEEFWTLKSNKANNLPNIFCNYEKRSRFLPLILEFFLPGFGHIIMKKYLLGIIKIILCIASFSLLYSGYHLHIKEEKEEKNKIIKEEEEIKLINNENINDNNKIINIPLKESNKEANLEKINNSGYSDDIDNNNTELEKPYEANHEKKPIPLGKSVLNKILFICLICFFILYIFDLFSYGFAFYKDSNNVPFL